jgi:hypothetical protein
MDSKFSPLVRGVVVVAVALSAVMAVMTFVVAEQATLARAERDQAQAAVRALEDMQPGKTGASSNNVALLRRLLDEKDAAYIRLRHEYDTLKSQTMESTTADTASPTEVSQVAAPAPGGNARGRAWMEQLRQQDPERYKQMVEARQQWQQATDQRLQDQFDVLNLRAQNASTPDEAQLVNQITDTLDKINQLRQSRESLADLPDDQRQVQMQQINAQMHQQYDTLNTLRDQDRTLQLQNLAAQLGLQDQKVQALVEGVPQIYQNTQYQVQRGQGGPGGSPGGRFTRGTVGGNGTTSGGQPQPPPQPQR